MAIQPIPAICYDLHAVSRFCRSVALATAFQQHTRTEWVEQRDSSVLNAVYSVLFWKSPPGVVEVHQGSKLQIEQTTNAQHQRFLVAWLTKLHQGGPMIANQYIAQLAEIREFARSAVQQTLRDASRINREVAGQLGDAITDLARIRLAGTVGVAALGAAGALVLAPAGAMICGGLSFGYSTSCSLIKTWEQGGWAKAAGVAIEVGKAGGSEVLGSMADSRVAQAIAQQSRAEQIIQSCEGEIRKFSQRLGQEGLRKAQYAKAQNIVTRATTQVAGQQQVITQATRAARLANAAKVGVPLVFAAWDIYEGFSDYAETMDSIR